MTRNELIAALELATVPDRELDAEIDQLAYENGWRSERIMTPDRTPSYTASIDAALTLVPEGYCWDVARGYVPEATVWQIGTEYDEGSGRQLPHSQHPVPAIALCIAALKARPE